MEGHWKFLRGRELLKAKILEEKYEAKLEFPGDENNKPSMVGVWIFSGTAQCHFYVKKSPKVVFDHILTV